MGTGDEHLNKRDTTRRQKAKQARGRRAAAVAAADWRAVDWRPVAALTIALADAGGALRLGSTRDGGAYALGVYLGDDYATEYVKPTEDWRAALGEIAEAWLPDKGDSYLAALDQMDRPDP